MLARPQRDAQAARIRRIELADTEQRRADMSIRGGCHQRSRKADLGGKRRAVEERAQAIGPLIEHVLFECMSGNRGIGHGESPSMRANEP
jgi:hypothetical protein